MKNLALFVVYRYQKALHSKPTARRIIRRELEAVLMALQCAGVGVEFRENLSGLLRGLS